MEETTTIIRIFEDLDKSQIGQLYDLWNNEYPINIRYETIREFEGYLNNLHDSSHYLLIDKLFKTIAWCCVFERDQERWFAIIVDSRDQSKGIGSSLLHHIQKKYDQLNGWVIDHNNDIKSNGDNYISPLSFYLKNDFTLIPEIRLELEKISAVKISWKNIK